MDNINLYHLARKAKEDDKEALMKILVMFEPAINKAVRRSSKQDQHDLQQYLTEKIIKAIRSYNLDAIPDFEEFINSSANFN